MINNIFTVIIILITIIGSLGNGITYSSTINDRSPKTNTSIMDISDDKSIESDMNSDIGARKSVEEIYEEVAEEKKDEEMDENCTIIEFDIAPLQLREGVASDEVFRVREYLKIKGYTDIGEGNYFDYKLHLAVKRFQSENNLDSGGIIGPKTFKVINDDMILNSISIGYNEIVLPDEVPKEKWILINKESNTLYLYKNKELIDKYPIATGKTPAHTPEGEFYIIKKFVNPFWGGAGKYKPVNGGAPNNPLGRRWLGLNIGAGGTYGIHGNSDINSIGKYVSLGCIRMFNEDIESIYDIIEYNTPVWIVRDN